MARQQPESALVSKIRLKLISLVGGSWTKIHGGAYQQNGVSDLIGCVDGRFVALEVKVPGREGTLTKLQERYLEEIHKAGGIAAMVSSVDQAIDIVKEQL